MRKLRILVMLIILAFSFSVKAEVFLEIDCNSKEIENDKNITCELYLVYEEVSINDIEISYQTNLDINFIPVDDFTINKSNNKIVIHTDEALYDDIMNSTKIMEFTLSSNDKSNEQETLSFNNIKINNTTDEIIDEVSEIFNITKINKLDSVCTLDSITVEKEEVKNYNKDIFEYDGINVKNEVIFIDAVRTSDKSSASGLGNVIVSKESTIERDIVVLAEDGSKCVYKLHITNTTPNKSSDNTLKSLELYNNKNKIDFKFDTKINNYNIDIEDDVNEITIKATLNDNKASFINNYGPRDIKISYGINKVLLKVKAENNEEKTYTININYLDNRDQDNTLLSLKVNDRVVDLTNEKLEVTLPYNIDKTIIEAIASSNKANVNYEDISLEEGDNELSIIVTSESGLIKEYKLNINRDKEIVLADAIAPSFDNFIEDDYSIYYVIFGVVILFIIILIIYLIKKRKTKKTNIEEI